MSKTVTITRQQQQQQQQQPEVSSAAASVDGDAAATRRVRRSKTVLRVTPKRMLRADVYAKKKSNFSSAVQQKRRGRFAATRGSEGTIMSKARVQRSVTGQTEELMKEICDTLGLHTSINADGQEEPFKVPSMRYKASAIVAIQLGADSLSHALVDDATTIQKTMRSASNTKPYKLKGSTVGLAWVLRQKRAGRRV